VKKKTILHGYKSVGYPHRTHIMGNFNFFKCNQQSALVVKVLNIIVYKFISEQLFLPCCLCLIKYNTILLGILIVYRLF